MYIMHDILGSYITNDHQLSQLRSCHCYKITKIFEKLEHFKNGQITFGLEGTDHWVLDAATHGGRDLASLSDGLQFVQGFTMYCSIYGCSSPFINLGPPRLLMFTVTR